MAGGTGRSGRIQKGRNPIVGQLENSLGIIEGGWPRISELGSKAGEQVGLVWIEESAIG